MIVAIDTFPGRTITVEGKSFLYFGGTSYLGMGTNSEFLELYKSKLNQFGAFYGASRQGNLRLGIYGQAERFLSGWCGAGDAILLSSGYLAGQLCVSQFFGPGYRILVSPYCHSALWPQNAVHFKTFASLGEHLQELLNSGKLSPIPVIFTDAVNSGGDGINILNSLKNLPLERCILVIDDSHAIGIVGEQGSGSYREFSKLEPQELLVSCSLGKALGIGAGVVLGSEERLSTFRQSQIYAGASPPSPSALATFLDAQEIYESARKVLREHIKLFNSTFKNSEIIMVKESLPFAGTNSIRLIKYLNAKDILISNFKYDADPSGTLGRIVLTSAHQKSDVIKLINLIDQFDNG